MAKECPFRMARTSSTRKRRMRGIGVKRFASVPSPAPSARPLPQAGEATSVRVQSPGERRGNRSGCWIDSTAKSMSSFLWRDGQCARSVKHDRGRSRHDPSQLVAQPATYSPTPMGSGRLGPCGVVAFLTVLCWLFQLSPLWTVHPLYPALATAALLIATTIVTGRAESGHGRAGAPHVRSAESPPRTRSRA